MCLRKARRHQSLYGLSEQFIPGVTKLAFSTGIGQHDRAYVIDNDHAIRRRLNGEVHELLIIKHV